MDQWIVSHGPGPTSHARNVVHVHCVICGMCSLAFPASQHGPDDLGRGRRERRRRASAPQPLQPSFMMSSVAKTIRMLCDRTAASMGVRGSDPLRITSSSWRETRNVRTGRRGAALLSVRCNFTALPTRTGRAGHFPRR